jgi:lactoylglutathione lyase
MKFNWTTLWVKDMDTSLRFYQEIVSLPLQRRYVTRPGMEIAFLGSEEAALELICDKSKETIDVGADVSVGFESGPLETIMEELQARGIAIHSGPFQPNQHIRYLFVQDPDGWKVQFVQQM